MVWTVQLGRHAAQTISAFGVEVIHEIIQNGSRLGPKRVSYTSFFNLKTVLAVDPVLWSFPTTEVYNVFSLRVCPRSSRCFT